MRVFKITCIKDPTHKKFSVTAHVAESWEVDEFGDWLETISTDQTIHAPDIGDRYLCLTCNQEASTELLNDSTEEKIK